MSRLDRIAARQAAAAGSLDAERIEPVRSARLTDPPILKQYGRPLFGYAGGVSKVIHAVAEAGLIDVNYLKAVRLNSGLLTATGTVVKTGSRVGFSEGVVTDASGAVVATATSTLLIFDL